MRGGDSRVGLVPEGTVVRSDDGTQYTRWAFGRRLRVAGPLGSMGTVGDTFDNSAAESFFGSLQLEFLDPRPWKRLRFTAGTRRARPNGSMPASRQRRKGPRVIARSGGRLISSRGNAARGPGRQRHRRNRRPGRCPWTGQPPEGSHPRGSSRSASSRSALAAAAGTVFATLPLWRVPARVPEPGDPRARAGDPGRRVGWPVCDPLVAVEAPTALAFDCNPARTTRAAFVATSYPGPSRCWSAGATASRGCPGASRRTGARTGARSSTNHAGPAASFADAGSSAAACAYVHSRPGRYPARAQRSTTRSSRAPSACARTATSTRQSPPPRNARSATRSCGAARPPASTSACSFPPRPLALAASTRWRVAALYV